MTGTNQRIIAAAKVLEDNLKIAASNADVRFADRSKAIVTAMGFLAATLSQEMGGEYPDITNSKQISRVHKHLVALLDSLQKKIEFDNKKPVDFTNIKIQTALDWMLDGLCLELRKAGLEKQKQNEILANLTESVDGFEHKLNKLLKGSNFPKYETITTPQVIAFNKERDTVPKDDTREMADHSFLVFDPGIFSESVREVGSNPDLSFSESINLIQKAMVSLFALLLTDFKDEFPTFENSEMATNELKLLMSIQKALYKRQGLLGGVDVDLQHIKVQAGFDYIIDASVSSMVSAGISDKVIGEILLALARRMRGFEKDANQRMRGLTSDEVKALKSPFLQEDTSSGKIKY